MGLIQTRIPWMRQPQVPVRLDKSNPLGAVLDRVWIANSLSGIEHDRGSRVVYPSGAILVPKQRGIAVQGVAGGGGTGVATNITTFPIVVMSYGYFTSSATIYYHALLSGSFQQVSLELRSATESGLSVRLNGGTAKSVPVTVAGNNSGAPICMIGIVYSGTDYRVYVNGVEGLGTLNAGTTASLTTAQPGGINALAGGVWLSGYGSGRAISGDLAKKITANPEGELWQIFQPQTRRIWVPDAVGGAITHATTGALTGPGSAISGTAAHIAIHGTTGVLSGPGATVAGTATNFTVHETTGALTGAGSAVAGTSAHIAIHGTSGVLAGQGAAIAGVAERIGGAITHSTTGALAGPGAAITGAAATIRIHGTTGTLAGSGASIVGVAARASSSGAGRLKFWNGSIWAS